MQSQSRQKSASPEQLVNCATISAFHCFLFCTLKKYWLLFGASVIIGLALVIISFSLGRQLRALKHLNGAELNPAVPAVGFRLLGADGRPLELSALRGTAVLLYFGYTHCQQDCPAVLQRLAEVLQSLGNNSVRVEVVMVSIDPLRDTPAILQRFIEPYGPGFSAAVGQPQETHDLAASYDLDYATDAQGKIAHTPLVFLIDPAGCWRAVYPPALSALQISADLDQILQEPLSSSPCSQGLPTP